MKALVCSKEKTLEYTDVLNPVIKEDDVLVRVESVGICGSDMHAFLGHDERRPTPLILGHEAAGLIVSGKNEGKRVTINPLISCLNCVACRKGRNNICPNRQLVSIPPRQGAFAELLAVPRDNTIIIPENVNITAAALTEPLACGWHAVKLSSRTLDVSPNDAECLILGGGAIGVGVCLALEARGFKNITIVESNGLRYEMLLAHFESEVTIKKALDSNLGFDFVIDAVGYLKTREIACDLCKPGGVIAHIGLGDNVGGLDARRMTLQEITFIGTYTYNPVDFEETAEAIFQNKMGDFGWVEERALKHGHNAFLDILNGKVSASKIVLKP